MVDCPRKPALSAGASDETGTASTTFELGLSLAGGVSCGAFSAGAIGDLMRFAFTGLSGRPGFS
ncbi:hypothetical protein [Variovorax sp. OV329]|uniref:hypothetical protein n=1 Tax=Variovorax sp. OV329 TaxID=1882825 RepID=UPI0008EBA02A|nr:hypothetical protein [Variovorax sp. OV329]SFM33494.1 hypothetical protein SAMN05444747_104356 [Variovorax sp. OV329]